MRLIDADAILHTHKIEQKAIGKDWGVDDLATAIMVADTVDAIPVEWLQYMQQECLSENDRTMVGAIEAIFIEWHIYVNRLREMNRQKEQEDA